MAAPFSGSAKELGHEMKIGIEAAFGVVNDADGIYGRQLTLVAADDGYEPARTADAVRELRDKGNVFGMIGNVGTPTAMVSLPYALEHRMLFFGAFTGANLLRRDPPDRYVFNYRASYAEETDAVVRYLVKIRHRSPRRRIRAAGCVRRRGLRWRCQGHAGAARHRPGDPALQLQAQHR